MVKRIMITGPESTGKSMLAQALAAHYQTEWVPEVARTYLKEIGRPYQERDLLEIAKAQMALEEQKARKANRLLFCDTGMLVLKIWSEHSYGRCHPWILRQWQEHSYTQYLLPDIDMPWQPDPQREHPHLREYFFKLYKEHLQLQQLPFQVISGLGETRLKRAIQLIDSLLSGST